MEDPLDGLDGAERLACRVAERVTGATARAWDKAGRQGVVDAFLDYPDGRLAAFEVTRAAMNQSAIQLDHLLGRIGHGWDLPGQWYWDVIVGDVRDLRRLEMCFRKIVLICEEAGVSKPELLVPAVGLDPDEDVDWLTLDSSSRLQGYPNLSALDGTRRRKAAVVPDGVGGMVDENLTGLNDALKSAFTASASLRRHVRKVADTPADEHHLFVILNITDLDFGVVDGIMYGNSPPTIPAWRPEGITHLWLAADFSKRVLLSSGKLWEQAFPYDNEMW
ncbi:hypothetical protein [Actinokineospora sp. NBRC 105648]|uniref:hypothetical protein n=1 Tax=Actinokineospora sp. NBRC 105648 TaxID=3032206 RepID=UPI00255728EC|nr:hypothetical protein [Actinokineospora sp. NBRC 105648]